MRPGVEAIPDDLSPSQDRVLAALKAGGTETVLSIGDALAKDGRGKPLRKRTIQEALKVLLGRQLVDGSTEEGKPGEWWAA